MTSCAVAFEIGTRGRPSMRAAAFSVDTRSTSGLPLWPV
ncbi:hypothetical protein MAA44156_02942 [Mycobacterium avium subsp. avium]|nr:hypothetical protein MAA44156_02942 [Mycobacterium avium subsp. avium]